MNPEEYLTYFDTKYKAQLEKHPVFKDRYNGFRVIFKTLLEKKRKDFAIVETGTLRKEGAWTDGQSSLLFFEFVSLFGGTLTSIDTDRAALETCKSVLDKHIGLAKAAFIPICGDSVQELEKLGKPADILYLDSYDLESFNPLPSAIHHLKELASASGMRSKSEGLIVAVDDNYKDGGKGMFIKEWARETGKTAIHDGLQFVFSW